MDAHEIIRRCRVLADCTEEPGRITRRFLSPPMREVHRLVRGWMEAAGMRVWIDAAGNIRGTCGDGPRVMIGSHLDTVPDAGAFDGILGVMIGIALVDSRPPCALEVVGFSDEEGARFGIPFIGSRALVGDPVTDPPVLEAIRQFGLDPAQLPQTALGPAVRAYLEFHIEQGPVLDDLGLPLASVTAIAGQSRADVHFIGQANHAGTTPMQRRHDALAAAAEWISLVEREAQSTAGLVATVGRIEARPGAANVIAGDVCTTLDVRHADDLVRSRAAACLAEAAREIARRRGISAAVETRLDQPAVAMHIDILEHPPHRMVSGAGHDAMILARKAPAGMLFLRSPRGISHHPDETVLPGDVEAALDAGRQFLDRWRPE